MTPELEIRQRQKEGICILDLVGRLTIGISEQQLRSAVSELREGGVAKLVLNLAGVDDID